MATKKEKKVKEEKKVRVPSHVKTAAKTLGEHLSCDVEPLHVNDEWVLSAKTDVPDLFSAWKGVKVRRG